MRDLKALSQSISDALAALPADVTADTRVTTISQLIADHASVAIKAISTVDAYGQFLRDSGFAKAAVKKLAPAFKSIAGDDARDDAASEAKIAALTDVLATIREVAGTLNPNSLE